MTASLNWNDLRPWHGSQNGAFEELCAQLAEAETPAVNSNFFRKAAPDAGIECFWRLPGGDELAWQAKFFQNMGDSQWKQLDESVARAIDRHPRLIKYTVCAPLNLADPRIEGKTFSMDRWNDSVTKWEGWARKRAMRVAFEYWGEHQIARRLLQDKHRGLTLYWFRKELFSQEWFQRRLDEAIANADQRYLPELNVDLAIKGVFDGLGRTPKFFNQMKAMQGKVRRAYEHLRLPTLLERAKEETVKLQARVQSCLLLLGETAIDMQPLPLTLIAERALAIADCAQRVESITWSAARPSMDPSTQASASSRSLEGERYYLSKLIQEARELAYFVESHEALVANTPALALVGEAGMGKTHLLCHVAQSRALMDCPSIPNSE